MKASWWIESDSKLLLFFLGVIGALGWVLVAQTRDHFRESNHAYWGFWVGAVLISFALGVLIFFEQTRIEVDESNRKLAFEKRGVLGRRSYALAFEEVASIHVQKIGRRHKGWVTYHLVIRLKDGKKEAPGRFSFSQFEIVDVAQRLASSVGCDLV